MKSLLYFTLIVLFCSNAYALKAQKVASNLGDVIWGMSFINDHELLITLKKGSIKKINFNTNQIQTIANIDVLYEGQGGLLDIALSPNFSLDKTVYFTYVKNVQGDGATTLAKAQLIHGQWKNQEDILVTQSRTDTSRHFGSRIAFDNEGHLYFTIGDRGVRPNGQDLQNHAGSVLRLNIDGSVAKNNPFIKTSALDEIYSYGHRNPQGIFYDSTVQKLFVVEHGPRGGDEINVVKKGLNYGWPIISYGKEYWNPMPVGEGTHKEGMEQPIKVYIPSIAPSSMVIYRGSYYPSLQNKILVGALKLQHINVLEISNNLRITKETRLFEDLNERIRCITISKQDHIYFSTDSGNIYKIVND